MTPVVVVLVALLALVALGALLVLVVSRIVRHWSRTREQANVVFAVQMELMAVVQAALQRCDGSGGDGAASDAEWNAIDARARAAADKSARLLRDGRLRQLTAELLDCTGRLRRAGGAGETAGMRREVEGLQESFRARSNEVVRDLRLRR